MGIWPPDRRGGQKAGCEVIDIAVLIIGGAIAIAVVWWNDRQQWLAELPHTRSRDFAHWRLRHIIAADRSAVPCGRWVEVECQWPSALLSGLKNRPKSWKTHYRYEVRR